MLSAASLGRPLIRLDIVKKKSLY